MTNYEKYKDLVEEIILNGSNVALKNGKASHCQSTICEECGFAPYPCTQKRRDWLNAEYVEFKIDPNIDWTKIEVDTPVLVKDFTDDDWERRHFAKFENDKVYCFESGKTSWTTKGLIKWDCAKLANKED